MSKQLTAGLDARHLLKAEIGRPRMAKAELSDLRKAENGEERTDFRVVIGRAIERTMQLAGITRLQQFADAIGRDERQVARWISGTERPQFDAIFAVVRFRGFLVIALAELSNEVDVQTTITIRRAG